MIKQAKIGEFITTGHGIVNNNRLLAIALGVPVRALGKQSYKNWFGSKNTLDTNTAVLAWGQKASANKARQFAKQANLPLWTVEDGFLRSLDSGIKSRYGASFVLDDLGIYFDVTSPSRLEQLIADRVACWLDDDACRAKSLINKIIHHQLSKYNPSTPHAQTLPPHSTLVIDQVAGDASIQGAGADSTAFYRMLLLALQAHQQIHIKAHPAAKVGFLVDEYGQLNQDAVNYLLSQGISQERLVDIHIIKHATNPIALLHQAKSVYTVSSHLGFEALMMGKVVHCFGVSWYSAYGLTCDDGICTDDQMAKLYRLVKARRLALGVETVNLEQLFFASYIDYSHYADPATGKACQIETVIDYLIRNRDWQSRLAGDLLAYEFSRWKVGFVKGYVGFPEVNLAFKAKTKMCLLFSDTLNARRATRDDKLALSPLAQKPHQRYLVWGLAAKRSLADKIHIYQNQTNPTIICMEDGFIRSNGLGATLLEPLSVVMDDVGVYYDATAPSRLEQILQSISLDDDQAKRARLLHQSLLDRQVSKYNVGKVNDALSDSLGQLITQKPSAKVRLVVGQVEDDASVQNCTSIIKTNTDLLKRVRADHPDDIIIYKPHPDIEAGLRVGKVDDATLSLADIIAHDTAMPQCLSVCDVVHTISSQTGFEALLRGVAVVCYGMPFYAGFGLTTDVVESDNLPKQAAIARRTRQTPLSLEALIYGTLIDYPVYRLPHGYGLASVEQVIDYLYNQQQDAPKPSLKKRIIQAAKTNFMRLRRFTI